MSATHPLSILGSREPIEPSVVWPDDKHEDEDMPPRRTGEHATFDADGYESLMRMMAQSAMRADERIAAVIETRAPAETMAEKLLKWVSPLMMVGVLVVTTTRSYSTSENNLSQQISELKMEHKNAIALADEKAKQALKNVLMLDTYNRELERALIKQGKVNLPPYPTLEK